VLSAIARAASYAALRDFSTGLATICETAADRAQDHPQDRWLAMYEHARKVGREGIISKHADARTAPSGGLA
jgi:hypothetical protein